MIAVVFVDHLGRETRQPMALADFREWMRAGGWTDVCARIDAGTYQPGGLYIINEYRRLRVLGWAA